MCILTKKSAWEFVKTHTLTRSHDQNGIIFFRPIVKFVKIFASNVYVWKKKDKEREVYFEAMIRQFFDGVLIKIKIRHVNETEK
jgi:hypothetical protein